MKRATKNLIKRILGRSFLDENVNAQTIIDFHGVKFFAGKTNKIEAKLLNAHGYDRQNLTVCQSFIRPGDICLDVGANIGVYSVLMAKWAGPSGNIHAFEPVDHIRRKLKLNIRLNGFSNVTVNPIALGEKEGFVSMNQVKEGQFRGGTSTLTQNENVLEMCSDKFESVQVSLKTVDSYIAESKLERIDFAKIDIEGYEINFLLGAEQLLTEHRPIIVMEHNQRRLKFLGIEEKRFEEIFKKAQYRCFELLGVDDECYFIPYYFDRKMHGMNLACIPY